MARNGNEYGAEHYFKILLRIPAEQREYLKAAADAAGVSVNRYILEAVEARNGLKLTLDNALPWIKNGSGRTEK